MRDELDAAAAALDVALTPAQSEGLLAYLALLQKWNKVYNLTAVRDPQGMLRQHLVDSLAVVAPLRRELAARGLPSPSMLDVGSGAGLPGTVLAVTLPHVRVVCVDAVDKKAAFVRQVAAELGLLNLSAEHARVEHLQGRFDVITSRAFASLADFVGLTRGLLAPSGCWMAMKGKRPDDEIAALDGVEVFHVEQLQVPRLGADRCIVWMRPSPTM